MENHRPQRFAGSRGPPPQPQPQPPPQQFDPNFLLLQSMGLYPNNQNLLFQNPNLLFQNPNSYNNFPTPNNPGVHYHNNNNNNPIAFPQNHPNLSSPATTNNYYNNNNPSHPPLQNQNQQRNSESISIRPNPKFPNAGDRKETLDKVETAVASARRQIIGAGEHVSVWKLSQCALAKLQADSWDSLGFQLHQVPSLHQLFLVEAQVNTFIRCHVAVHKITSLFDLQEAICKNECVEKFEELELGPFLRHPLVMHYFSLSKDIEEVYKITSDQVVSYLLLFYSKNQKNQKVVIQEFLDFVARKCKVTNPRLLGLRIQSLGLHIGFFHKAQNAQNLVLEKCMEPVKEKCDKPSKKRPLFSLQKKELDNRFSVISERVTSFASVNKDFRGKHIRFVSSSSDENEGMTDISDTENLGNDGLTSNQSQSSLVKRKNGDRVSSCPYPSVAEERTRLGLKGEIGENSSPHCNQRSELPKKKRKLKSRSHGKADEQGSFLLSGSTEPEEENNSKLLMIMILLGCSSQPGRRLAGSTQQ